MSWKATLRVVGQVIHWVRNKLRMRRVLNQITPPSDSSAIRANTTSQANANRKRLRRTGATPPRRPTTPVAATKAPMYVPANYEVFFCCFCRFFLCGGTQSKKKRYILVLV